LHGSEEAQAFPDWHVLLRQICPEGHGLDSLQPVQTYVDRLQVCGDRQSSSASHPAVQVSLNVQTSPRAQEESAVQVAGEGPQTLFTHARPIGHWFLAWQDWPAPPSRAEFSPLLSAAQCPFAPHWLPAGHSESLLQGIWPSVM
jgi:hypothetical protein